MCVAALAVVPVSPPAAQGQDGAILEAAGAVALEAANIGLRHWLNESRQADEKAGRFGLRLDDQWREAADQRPQLPLVVLIHGFNSNPDRNAALLYPIRAAGFPCAVFAYPNDWAIAKSAQLMSRQLKAFVAKNPDRKLALVTHSMGGLVARACVEDRLLDPGNVAQLLMIAPPSQGTIVARIAVATDLWEHFLNRKNGDALTRLRDSLVDGVGEAVTDLTPNSPFLTRLNSRPRNPQIRYAIFLGDRAGVSKSELALIRQLVGTAARNEYTVAFANSADSMLVEMNELVDGQGDGVVAVERGRLAGVDDVVILPFDHVACTGPPECDGVRKLQQEILARLSAVAAD